MISSRWIVANGLAWTIRPPFDPCAKAVTARSSSATLRTSTGLNSTPNEGAADWIAPSWPVPVGRLGSRMTATRIKRGAICLSNSSHFALLPYSNRVKPVTLPPGRAKLATKPPPTGSVAVANTIGTVRGACTPAIVDLQVAADGPAPLLQPLQERCKAGLSFRIVRGRAHEHADAPHPLALLRARRERPRSRAADKRDELAALHSITSSARASSVGGTSRPRVLAVLRFITSSNLVGCITGKSPGFSPLRIRPT